MTQESEVSTTTSAAAQQFQQSYIQLDLNRLESALSEEAKEGSIAGLASKNRMLKRRALESIAAATLATSSKSKPTHWIDLSVKDKQYITGAILPVLLQCWRDPAEKCRELSISLVQSYLQEDSLQAAESMPSILDGLSERLLPLDPRNLSTESGNNFGTSSADLLGGAYSNTSQAVEPSEELRLQLVRLLTQLIDSLGRQLRERDEFVDSILPFLGSRLDRLVGCTLGDSFHEVKKESCRVLMTLGGLASSRAVGMLSLDRLSASVLSILFHKHSAVRTAAIQALGVLIKADAKPLEEQQTVDLLYRLAGDRQSTTRQALYAVVCDWLLTLRDRYGYAARLLGLVLYGLTDEIDVIRQMVESKVEQMADMYEFDNEERLKDELDYCGGEEQTATGSQVRKRRPRTGARHLFRDNTQKTLDRLMEGCGAWTEELRLKSFKCLLRLLPFTEHNITGYVGQILSCLLRSTPTTVGSAQSALSATDKECLSMADSIVHTMSSFIRPSVYLTCILPVISASGTALPTLALALRFLGVMLSASPADRFSVPGDDMQDLLQSLLADALVECQDQLVGERLVEAVQSTVCTLQRVADCRAIDNSPFMHDNDLFRLFYAVLSLISQSPLAKQQQSISDLCKLAGCADRLELFRKYCDRLWQLFSRTDCRNWSRLSRPPQIMLTVLRLEPSLLAVNCEFCRLHFFPLLKQMITHGDGEINFDTRKFSMDCMEMFLDYNYSNHDDNNNNHDDDNNNNNNHDNMNNNNNNNNHDNNNNNNNHDNNNNNNNNNLQNILEEILLPNMLWHGDRRSIPIRQRACACLLRLINHTGSGEKEMWQKVLRHKVGDHAKTAFRILLDCLDDDCLETRRLAISILNNVLTANVDLDYFTDEEMKDLYGEALKRLDDGQDCVRIDVCQLLFVSLLSPMTAQQAMRQLDAVHHEHICRQLFIHLDDSDEQVRQAVYAALTAGKGGVLSETLVKQQMEAVCVDFRHKIMLENL